jgi:branched-chain amino acid transport system substrate-binding protein
MRRNFLQAALTLIAAVSCASSFAQGTGPIKIGSVLSLTGPADYLGDNELKTLQLYVDKINESGGVLGRKLQLVSYDDASDANKANGFAKRLIEADNIDFLIGGSTTGATMAMVPLVEKAGVPFISLGGAGVIIEPVKKWVFKVSQTDRMIAERVLQDMKKRGIARIGILAETTGYGQSGRKETQAQAAKYGVTVVADESYGTKDTDMSVQLTKLKNATGIQAVFVFGAGQAPAIITKNYRQLDIKLPLYHAAGVASDEFLQLAGPAAEGVRLPSPALLVADQLADKDPQKALLLAYDKAYTLHHKSRPNTFGGYAYDALSMAVAAIKRAGTVEKAAVRNALEQTRGLVDTAGTVNMSATDHLGVDGAGFRMIEAAGGKWKLVP